MRRLSLHASALSNSEYELFTKSLEEIVDNDHLDDGDDIQHEKLVVGIREARAWLRGRYSHITVANIDGILKLFCPKLSPGDTITGAEFFAALRLVIHVESGKDIDRSLAFVQVDIVGRSSSPSKSTSTGWTASTPIVQHSRVESTLQTPSSFPNTASPHNPFTRSADAELSFIQPPVHPSHRSESSRTAPSAAQRSSLNPFTHSGPRSDDGASSSRLPPLPPRKPTALASGHHQATPSNRSNALPLGRLERSLSPSKRFGLIPPVPPKPASHVTSTLIKQSLTASKVAQSMKKAEEQLDKERVMQVLKSSSVVSGTNIHNSQQPSSTSRQPRSAIQRHSGPASSEGSASDGGTGYQTRQNAPPLPKRRNTQQGSRPIPSQQPSPPLSASSLEQVALATAPDHHHQRERAEHQLDHVPPPTHPDRKPHLGYHHIPPSTSPASSTPTPGSSDYIRAKNLETFEAIYGPMTSSPKISPAPSNDPSYFPTMSRSTVITPNPDLTDSDSPSARVFRSKSLNQTAKPVAPPIPPPPLRKRRPESFQVLGSPTEAARSTGFNGGGLSRHHSSVMLGHRRSSSTTPSVSQTNSNLHGGGMSSASTASTSSSGFGGNIQRTIDALHSIHGQIQPKLDKARYKAEAGLSRRGYVRGVGHGESRSPSRVEEREEREVLTFDGSRRNGRRPSMQDKWQEGYLRRESDGAEVDGYVYEETNEDGKHGDESWRRGRLPIPPPMVGPAPAATYGNSKNRPRNVFDDSPEREDTNGRSSDARHDGKLGWAPL